MVYRLNLVVASTIRGNQLDIVLQYLLERASADAWQIRVPESVRIL
jgi:hypothetical protein